MLAKKGDKLPVVLTTSQTPQGAGEKSAVGKERKQERNKEKQTQERTLLWWMLWDTVAGPFSCVGQFVWACARMQVVVIDKCCRNTTLI